MKLKINGKDLEFSFGLGFLGELLDETGKDMNEVLEALDKNPYKFIPLTMFVSCKYAYESKGQKIDFNKYQFFAWIDADGGLTDENQSAITFMEELTKSLFKDVPEEKGSSSKKK